MIRACINVQDLECIKVIYKLQSVCYSHFGQFESAIMAIERIKDIAEDSNDSVLLIQVWHNLAEYYTKLKKTQEALFCLQRMLQYAWIQNDKQAEVKAYDMLGIQFFNLGDIPKSNYYHNKAMKQETEETGQRIIDLAKHEIRSKN